MAATALELAEHLQRVLDGVITLDDLIEDPSLQGEPLENCFHGLQHYLADNDIRAKDAD